MSVFENTLNAFPLHVSTLLCCQDYRTGEYYLIFSNLQSKRRVGDCSPVFHSQSFTRLPFNLIASYNLGYLFINQSSAGLLVSYPVISCAVHHAPASHYVGHWGWGWAANSENLRPLNSRTVQLTMHAQKMELTVERKVARSLPSGQLVQKDPACERSEMGFENREIQRGCCVM